MDIQKELNKTAGFKNLALLASQVVEGFISGMHKSPFHGFSAEFAEQLYLYCKTIKPLNHEDLK